MFPPVQYPGIRTAVDFRTTYCIITPGWLPKNPGQRDGDLEGNRQRDRRVAKQIATHATIVGTYAGQTQSQEHG